MLIEGEASNNLGLCRTYSIANSIRSVSRTLQERRKRIFDLVYVDVEKVMPTGFNSYSYACIFTDDVTYVQ